MPAGTILPGRARSRRVRFRPWVIPAVLISLTATLAALAPAPQAALAASHEASLISAGGEHSCALEGGKAYCWGFNEFGQLGDGSTTSSSVPVAVDTSGALAGQTLTQITGGDDYTCALDAAGTAYCWGYNVVGQLGDGSTTDSDVPVAVDTSGPLAGQTLTQIAAGSLTTCALDAAGAAYCWGYNQDGNLGDGSTTGSSVPVAVDASGALAGQALTQITVGTEHVCSVDAAGAAYCWGDNNLGQLGGGSTAGSDVPVAVDTSGALAGQTLTQITAGASHTCALDRAGAAYCWGEGYYGQLGGGIGGFSALAVAVDTSGVLHGKALAQITAGEFHTCAISTAGAAYCWGRNDHRQLGDGKTADSSVPVAVDTSGVLAGQALTLITAGGSHTCALDSTSAVYCWGANDAGELGNDSNAITSYVPVLTGPQAPADVTAAPGYTTATVSWAAPASLDGGTLTGYTASAAPAGPSCTTAGATTCIIAGLTGGTSYSITVTAHTTSGDSGASAPATTTPTGPGAGLIVSGDHKTKCAEDPGNATANDTPIVISDCNGSAGQVWIVEPGGTLQVNGKCMDIYRDEKTSKAPLELWTCTGGANQQWQATNGTLVNPASGKCLDDPGFNTTDGTRLEIYTCNGGLNQQWQLP